MFTFCTKPFSSTRAEHLYCPLHLQSSSLPHPKPQCCWTPSSMLQGNSEGPWSPGSEQPCQINMTPCYPEIFIEDRREFDYHEFCSILHFLPDNNLPLQSNNNQNTNRREAFQKVMNSEASQPRRLWFKCMTPATQRGHQLYSPAIEEEKIIFQRVVARKGKKMKKML